MNASPAIATSGKFSSRLPNSIHELSSVWPELSAATALDLVQSGQSGQPSPDEESRTAAPVAMTTALEIIAASAHPCSDRSVGLSTGSIRRESTRTIVTLRSLRSWSAHSVRLGLGSAASAAWTWPVDVSGSVHGTGVWRSCRSAGGCG